MPRSSAEQLAATLGYWRGPILQVARGSSGVGRIVARFHYVRTTVEIAPQTLNDLIERQVGRETMDIMNSTYMQTIRQGQSEERTRMLTNMLTKRFGALPEQIIERIK